jgi:hypothetical protein
VDKPTTAALQAFESAFPSDARAVRRPMFGMPAGIVNGNLFLGVYADGVVLRLPADRLAALAAIEGIGPFEPGGRRWKEYLLAAAPRWGGTPELAAWAREALDHTAGLPAKVPKPKKS